MAEQVVLMDEPSPGVARLLINRPDKRNAIDYDVRQALIEYLDEISGDSAVRALVCGGVGGIFSAGGDVPSMAGLNEEQARARMAHIHQLCLRLAALRIPVVSALEGFGAGAAVGLALLGDHIVVGPGSKVLFPFMRLGLTPDWGTLQTLPARVGLPCARRLLTSGQVLSGEEAVSLGLADEFAADGDIMAGALRRAELMARLPQEAFARMKLRLNHPAGDLHSELQKEEDDQACLLLGADFREGFAAFSELRDPDFTLTARVEA
ncbi:enoyl-CoA hydratase/isomerase family protein [Pseudomonas aeruginosa]|uniref:enoyl-CoA hydratase/isomerase family protein n=1 Tax=Pseudomonas aeruginosa TaxID=287 RepID=UPI0031B687EC